jgi:Protein of unknwon function (DUF3310)
MGLIASPASLLLCVPRSPVANGPWRLQERAGKIAGMDLVNHPKHYQGNGLEVIDVIEAFELDFSLGNAVKYILRAGRKATYGGLPDEMRAAEIEDLEKAVWYLRHRLQVLGTANGADGGEPSPAGSKKEG